jgi:zinc transporter ZupT
VTRPISVSFAILFADVRVQFFVGMLFFGMLAQLVPNHEHDHGKDVKEKKKEHPSGKVDAVRCAESAPQTLFIDVS